MSEYDMKDMKGNTKDNNNKDVLSIYFHIKTKLENAPSLRKFFYHGWFHSKSHFDAVAIWWHQKIFWMMMPDYLRPHLCIMIRDIYLEMKNIMNIRV